MKKLFTTFILFFFFSNFFSQSKVISISGRGGGNIFQSDYSDTLGNINYGGNLSLYFTSSQAFGFGIIGDYTIYRFHGEDYSSNNYGYFKTLSKFAGGGIFIELGFSRVSALRLIGKGGMLLFEPRDGAGYLKPNNNMYKKSIFTAIGEIEYSAFLSDNFSFDVGVEFVQPFTDYVDDVNYDKWDYGFAVNAGFSIYFTSTNDSDGDGVLDEVDKCPDTPSEFVKYVDSKGCLHDTDGDGIPDGLDDCPNTNPKYIKYVNSYGCIIDPDGDGIPNGIDRCPHTPDKYVNMVDENGCFVDSDGDGIPDKMDKCPDTSPEVSAYVDSSGCVKDSDGDGVPDYKDNCPNTKENYTTYVNEDGCIMDSDGDGVPDQLDLCDKTDPKYVAYVDENGCVKDIDNDGFVILDKCPEQPETYNFVNDNDGCPDTAPYKMKYLLAINADKFFSHEGLSESAQETLFLTLISNLEDYPQVYWVIEIPKNRFIKGKEQVSQFINENHGSTDKVKFEANNGRQIILKVDTDKARSLIENIK